MRTRLSRMSVVPSARPPGQRRPTGPRTLLAEALEEGARERGAPARLLVLEVGVHALPGGHLAHPGRPAVEVGVRVVRATEPQVAEGRGGYRRGAQVLPIGDAQRGAVLAEEIVGLVVEPALVTELEGRLEARRERAEKVGEALGVEAEVGRELEEEGAELRAEPRRRAAERGGDLVGIAQAEHVRDALRGLQREAEAGRRLMRPAGEQLGRGEAAEGVVDLDRAERARVEAEHVARRQLLRVEAAAPGGVAEARGADQDARDAGRHQRRGARRRKMARWRTASCWRPLRS